MTEIDLLNKISGQLDIIEFTIVLFYFISWTKKIVIRFRKGVGLNE